MAYNVLKGSVEGTVDQHADQEIGGTKVFKSAISASMFYDTEAQSPCATLKNVAIQKIAGGSENSILLMGKNQTAISSHKFRYNNDTLHVTKVIAESIEAPATNLFDIPSNKFINPIKGEYICHNHGLENVRGNLQVKASDGIKCDEEGIALNINPLSGIDLISGKIAVNPLNATKINTNGQNVSDPDILLIHDVSRNTLMNTSLSNFYDSYINIKVPHAQGTIGALQYKGKKEFESCEKLSYDKSKSTLNVNGKVKANNVVSKQKTINEGAVYNNISKVSNKNYEVNQSDYTLLCDASDNVITINLPAAKNHVGRILIVKKANADKYKLNSNIVYVTCEEGTIDINDRIEIKMNYSSRTFQSDGENWWVIGSKGT